MGERRPCSMSDPMDEMHDTDHYFTGVYINGALRVCTRMTKRMHAAFVENRTHTQGGMNAGMMRWLYKEWLTEGEVEGLVGRPTRNDIRAAVSFAPYVPPSNGA